MFVYCESINKNRKTVEYSYSDNKPYLASLPLKMTIITSFFVTFSDERIQIQKLYEMIY